MGKWISTKDRLPETQGKYIVTYLTNTGRKNVEERWFSYRGYFLKGNGYPIAWQPMPEPYKGE